MWLDGLGSALLGGVVSAAVALYVVRRQIAADRDLAERAEDTRVAVQLQRAALVYLHALAHYEDKRAQNANVIWLEHPLADAQVELWTGAADAICRRPHDELFRAWARGFQDTLVDRTGDILDARPGTVDLLRPMANWTNYCVARMAAHLEHGDPLGVEPAEVVVAIPTSHSEAPEVLGAP